MRARCNFVMSCTNVRYGNYDFLGKTLWEEKDQKFIHQREDSLTESFTGPTSF